MTTQVDELMALAEEFSDGMSDADLRATQCWVSPARLAAVKRHRDEARAALRAAIEEALGQWRPIAEAPKDGTPVLLFGTWAGEINGIADDPDIGIGYWTDGRSDYPGTDWWNLTGGDAYSTWMRPVCWRPLPAPPADAASPGTQQP